MSKEYIMISAVRRLQFCYGHRVYNHESKCANLHGHNGVVFIHAKAPQGLDKLGRVIDFSLLKDLVGNWIEEEWDHRMILFKDDIATIDLLSKASWSKKPFILDANPTAENMAKFLLEDLSPKLFYGKGIIVHKVVFYETENCYAEVSIEPNDPKVLERFGILMANSF